MQRYIKATDAIDVLSLFYNYTDAERYDLALAISAVPTADVVERKKGKWVLIGSRLESRPYACSKCNYAFQVDTVMNKTAWNYCPNCGAKMERSDNGRFD